MRQTFFPPWKLLSVSLDNSPPPRQRTALQLVFVHPPGQEVHALISVRERPFQSMFAVRLLDKRDAHHASEASKLHFTSLGLELPDQPPVQIALAHGASLAATRTNQSRRPTRSGQGPHWRPHSIAKPITALIKLPAAPPISRHHGRIGTLRLPTLCRRKSCAVLLWKHTRNATVSLAVEGCEFSCAAPGIGRR